MDEQYMKTPFYGSRRFTAWLSDKGWQINRKRVQRLMNIMGIEAIYPKPKTSSAAREHVKYPYLLKGVDICRPNQVWSTDITYLPLRTGYMYLVAVIDWFSRYVLSWRVSNTMESSFCIEALLDALKFGTPESVNFFVYEAC